ncbi:DUF2956 domain-containing protein [Oceaniserpentilla sp. 4NH20-0058]|uniref:DUF2956 family protein n=1 Tax=Oceaniserpentilla sp. 4NH20-0058 TaxID=3127660 RepID=UPI00310A3964
MPKYSKKSISDKSLDEATTIANGTKKQGQSKEQSKLIAQGIAKGIEQYKKQQKAKAREKDKELKKQLKQEQQNQEPEIAQVQPRRSMLLLPWLLLTVSWVGFITYYSQN